MDPFDGQINFKLKREVLRLATRISAASPGSTVADYTLILGELIQLNGLEISEQNRALSNHLLFLQDMLQEMLQVPSRHSIATPPPSLPWTPASAAFAGAAGAHTGLQRGGQDELSSQPGPRQQSKC